MPPTQPQKPPSNRRFLKRNWPALPTAAAGFFMCQNAEYAQSPHPHAISRDSTLWITSAKQVSGAFRLRLLRNGISYFSGGDLG
jgi:hypothetical protein